MIEFEWSELKDQQNYWKHRVWFIEAQTVWKDPFAVEFFDPDHSENEDRHLIIGYSEKSRLLLLVFSEKSAGSLIRIISARAATLGERIRYEEGI